MARYSGRGNRRGSHESGRDGRLAVAARRLLPLLDSERDLKREPVYETGFEAWCRFNHLHAPFDNPAVRRALFPAIDQETWMIAMMGEDPALRKVPCGIFPPDSPMASDAGMENILPQPNADRAKRALQAAGYQGETVVLLVATDFPTIKGACDVLADTMRRAGVDYQAMDFGTLVQHRVSKKPCRSDPSC
jgi:peptide/nickel transport system substrate-binding protein